MWKTQLELSEIRHCIKKWKKHQMRSNVILFSLPVYIFKIKSNCIDFIFMLCFWILPQNLCLKLKKRKMLLSMNYVFYKWNIWFSFKLQIHFKNWLLLLLLRRSKYRLIERMSTDRSNSDVPIRCQMITWILFELPTEWVSIDFDWARAFPY